MRLHLVANSKSGRGGGASIKEVADKIAAELGAEIIYHQISDPAETEQRVKEAAKAAEQDGGVVAAAGGDGTVRSVAKYVIGKPIRFAVIPCGTFNLFARTHGIPENIEAALRLAMTGSATLVRVGSVNEEIFVLNASLGLYAKSIQDRKERTHRFGRHRIVALLSTVLTLMERHRLLNVELIQNGQASHTQTSMIFIGNNSLQLKNLSLRIADCMKKDLLAVVTMKATKRWEMLRILLRGISRSLEKDESLNTFCVDSLTIHTRQKQQTVALDGEMFQLISPFKVQSLPESLSLIKP